MIKKEKVLARSEIKEKEREKSYHILLINEIIS
jgi:hypothetical protein